MSSSKKITLGTSDRETFEVEEGVALESETMKLLIGVWRLGNVIGPLPNITGMILSKVIEYCKEEHVGSQVNSLF